MSISLLTLNWLLSYNLEYILMFAYPNMDSVALLIEFGIYVNSLVEGQLYFLLTIGI